MSEHVIDLVKLESIRDGSGHSIFGASGSWMYLNCSGSLIPNLLAPDDSGEDAAYGTVAHYVSETWRKTGERPDWLIGTNQFVPAGEWGYLIDIDEEMLTFAQMCVDETDLIPGTHYVEQRVDFSRITPIPNQGGRADFVSVDFDAGLMVVADDKYGKGHRVYAYKNTQAMLYALGAMWKFDPDGVIQRFLIKILQPRIDHFDEWEVSRDELLIFAGEAKVKMAAAWKANAPRHAGAHCLFCRVKSTCAARAKLDVDMLEGIFENLDADTSAQEMEAFRQRLDNDLEEIQPVDVATLTTAQMARLFPYRKASEKFWKSLHAELMTRAITGAAPDLKVVEGRGTRRTWRDEKTVLDRFFEHGVDPDEIHETKLKSPKQAELVLKAKGVRNKDLPTVMDGLTLKPPGKPTLVPVTDKRPALSDPSSLFEAIEDDEDSDI